MIDNETEQDSLKDAINRIVDTMTDGNLEIGPKVSCDIDTRILFANFKSKDGIEGLDRLIHKKIKEAGISDSDTAQKQANNLALQLAQAYYNAFLETRQDMRWQKVYIDTNKKLRSKILEKTIDSFDFDKALAGGHGAAPIPSRRERAEEQKKLDDEREEMLGSIDLNAGKEQPLTNHPSTEPTMTVTINLDKQIKALQELVAEEKGWNKAIKDLEGQEPKLASQLLDLVKNGDGYILARNFDKQPIVGAPELTALLSVKNLHCISIKETIAVLATDLSHELTKSAPRTAPNLIVGSATGLGNLGAPNLSPGLGG